MAPADGRGVMGGGCREPGDFSNARAFFLSPPGRRPVPHHPEAPSRTRLHADYSVAAELAEKIRALPDVSDVFIPQDLDYPSLRLDIDRMRAAELGLSQREVVGNVITALTSNQMIAPSYWVDPKSGNDYLLSAVFGKRSALPQRSEADSHSRCSQ